MTLYFTLLPLCLNFLFLLFIILFFDLCTLLYISTLHTYIHTYIHARPIVLKITSIWHGHIGLQLVLRVSPPFFLKKKKNHSNRCAAKYREKTYRDIGIYLISSFTVLLILRSNKRLDWIIRLEWLSSEMR